MIIEFQSLVDIVSFCNVVVDSLSNEQLANFDFLSDKQRETIEHAVYDFLNIFYIVPDEHA